VSIGLVAACRLAHERGLLPGQLLDRTRRLLRGCGLPVRPPDVADAALRARLKLDKKRRGATLRFVLPRALGQVVVVDDVTDDEALRALDQERSCASS
jgi:3-dehydroquinate synthase